jgi:sulfatase modifying factor 1
MVVAAQKANVFVAYSRADQVRAKPVITMLERLGFSVWWDVESIPIGVDWERFLTDQVAVAQSVVVLWSRNSVQSRWVRFEAEFAVRRSVFVPVLIEEVELPSIFNRFQAARLMNWRGRPTIPNSSAWSQLFA